MEAAACPTGVDQDARERRQPGEPLGPDRDVGVMTVARISFDGLGGCRGRRGGLDLGGHIGLAGVSLDQQLEPLAQLGRQLRRAEDPRMLAQPEHPRDQLTGVGIRGDEYAPAVLGRPHLSVVAEVALDLPGDPVSDPDLRRADRISELPVDPVGVRAWVEVRRALEVVLGLRRVPHLAAHPGQPKDADRAPFV